MNYLRLKKNKDFQKIFNRGKRVFSPALTLLYFPSDKITMGICVSKKHGKAHIRNRIKRLIREAFSKTCEKIDGNYALVILPKVAEEYSFKSFEKSLNYCIGKINLCAKN